MPTPIDRDGLQTLLAERAQLVEVLPAAEYEEEHLPGAINIPRSLAVKHSSRLTARLSTGRSRRLRRRLPGHSRDP